MIEMMQRGSGDAATVAVRRAGRLVVAVVVAFGLLFTVSTQIQSIRAHSPGAEDPYDAVVSIAGLILPVIAAITGLRFLRWRDVRTIPEPALRVLLRGIAVALGLVWATGVACVASVALRARADVWGLWFGLLVALVARDMACGGHRNACVRPRISDRADP
jgi:hypothetical protein